MSGNVTDPVAEPETEPAAEPPPTVEPPGTDVVPLSHHDVPARLADQIALAEAICKTNMLPAACRTAAGVMAAQRAAMALQVPLWTAMQEMHLIDGKVGWSVNFIRALVIRAGHKIRTIERTTEKAVVRIIRKDDPDPFYGEFTWAEAIQAGLVVTEKGTSKDNWRKYGKAMLVARATAIAVREACPEVLFGSGYTAEELGADTDEEGTPLLTVPAERAHVGADPAEQAAAKAKWRTDIAEAPDLEAVDALYQRAKKAGLLPRPLTEDGETVEAVLAARAHELRTGLASAAADDDDDVHDAEIVDPADPADGAVAPPERTGDEPDGDDPPPVPDPPAQCRDSARRRGVLKLLGEGGDIGALALVEFGLPVEQVATERLLKLHLRLAREVRA